jgi:hypothetical protein
MLFWIIRHHLGDYKPFIVKAKTSGSAGRKAVSLGADFEECESCGDTEWIVSWKGYQTEVEAVSDATKLGGTIAERAWVSKFF